MSDAPRRESPLLRRSPVWAIPALALCAWLLWDSWPDVAYFLSPRAPIDLGAPGAYRLQAALPNRLVRVAGAPAAAVGITDARAREERAVLGLQGLNLAVDRPGRATPAAVYEGRLLPAGRRADYAPAVAALQARGWEAGDRWMVVKDGERPGTRWTPLAWSVVLVVVAVLNARALWKSLLG